jgi:PTS system mannose-specific IIA component
MSDIKKVGGVIISHGGLANELLSAAQTVVGELDHLVAVSMGWNDDVESAEDQIRKAIKKVSNDNGVLILTDMFGGTPTNISAMFLEEGQVEIVTGVNLPMVIKLASQTKQVTLSDMAKLVEDHGKQAICMAGELLGPAKARTNG